MRLKTDTWDNTLETIYNSKCNFKGGAFKAISRGIGDITGGIIGTSHAEAAQRDAMRRAREEAERQTELMRKQIEEENRRFEEQMRRTREEAERARQEQERIRKEEETKRKAEQDYARQVAQDTGALQLNETQNAIRQQGKTNVDFSNSTSESNFKLKKDDDEDEDKKKLRNSFKFRV